MSNTLHPAESGQQLGHQTRISLPGNPHIHQHFKNYWTGQVFLAALAAHIHTLSSWFDLSPPRPPPNWITAVFLNPSPFLSISLNQYAWSFPLVDTNYYGDLPYHVCFPSSPLMPVFKHKLNFFLCILLKNRRNSPLCSIPSSPCPPPFHVLAQKESKISVTENPNP